MPENDYERRIAESDAKNGGPGLIDQKDVWGWAAGRMALVAGVLVVVLLVAAIKALVG